MLHKLFYISCFYGKIMDPNVHIKSFSDRRVGKVTIFSDYENNIRLFTHEYTLGLICLIDDRTINIPGCYYLSHIDHNTVNINGTLYLLQSQLNGTTVWFPSFNLVEWLQNKLIWRNMQMPISLFEHPHLLDNSEILFHSRILKSLDSGDLPILPAEIWWEIGEYLTAMDYVNLMSLNKNTRKHFNKMLLNHLLTRERDMLLKEFEIEGGMHYKQVIDEHRMYISTDKFTISETAKDTRSSIHIKGKLVVHEMRTLVINDVTYYKKHNYLINHNISCPIVVPYLQPKKDNLIERFSIKIMNVKRH